MSYLNTQRVLQVQLDGTLLEVQAWAWEQGGKDPNWVKRGADGRFGGGGSSTTAESESPMSSFIGGFPDAIKNQVQQVQQKLGQQQDPQNAAQKTLDYAQKNPGKVATAALLGAGLVLGLHPRGLRSFLKGAEKEGAQSIKQSTKVSRKPLHKLPDGMSIEEGKHTVVYTSKVGEHDIEVTVTKESSSTSLRRFGRTINFSINGRYSTATLESLSSEERQAAAIRIQSALAHEISHNEGQKYSVAAFTADSKVGERTLGYAKMGFGEPMLGIPGMPHYGKVVNGSMVPNTNEMAQAVKELSKKPEKFRRFKKAAGFTITGIMSDKHISPKYKEKLSDIVDLLKTSEKVEDLRLVGDTVMEALTDIRKGTREARRTINANKKREAEAIANAKKKMAEAIDKAEEKAASGSQT